MTRLSLRNSLLLGGSAAVFALATAPAMAQNNNGSGNETVIVTGTRVQGMTAADSAAPITVLGNDALTKGTGSTDLRQALGQTVPSFTAQQIGFDTAALTLSAALRGLSPNDTLVLVNGKRRHYTGNLHVDGGNFASGSSGADISLIPEAAVDHVEVLLDGAAAQYGTDAIAGVVNFILKKKSSGGTLSATAGRDYRGDKGEGKGNNYNVSVNMGLPLFDKGFANITVEKSFSDFTLVGGLDRRVADQATGALITDPAVLGFPLAVAQGMKNYPNINPIVGSPQTQITQAVVNAGYDFSDSFSVYAFGTFSHKIGKGWENVRMPNKVLAQPGNSQPCSPTNPNGYDDVSSTPDGLTGACFNGTGAGQFAIAGSAAPGQPGMGTFIVGPHVGQIILTSTNNGNYTTPGELIPAPFGFQPYEALKEDDYQYNIGTKFNVLGWDTDIGVGYGKDIDNIYTNGSLNRSLFIDTGTSPRNFYDGSFVASQLTLTVDATHQYNIGMASPLTVAIGGEAREDLYQITQGDAPSQYKEGGNSFPGFLNTDASIHSRKNYAAYIDLALAPIESLQLDLAGRAEHYTDFGDTQIGKFTARYDFSPQIAVRGTISTGFRAPTIAEEFYTATNVGPFTSVIQLPADSAASKFLGLNNLKPEISTSYSAGIVAHPFEDLSVTVDAYSTTLGNRIVTSSEVDSVNQSAGAITSPLVAPAIALTGRTLDPTVTQVGVTSFLNGLNTLTQGIDFTVNYPTDFGDYGLIDWTLVGNWNFTSISRVAPTPAVFGGSAVTFFRPIDLFNFVHSAPAEKVALTANWSLDEFGFTFRETYWGPQKNLTTPNGTTPYYDFSQAGVGLTDIEMRYNITEGLQLAVGANNVFNIRPNHDYFVPSADLGTGALADGGIIIDGPVTESFNPNGGLYYGRVTFNF
ncbi:MAG TPA: TonB-dependent receptor [Rhizomicrobium sp.]|nr:TonB-dependent receptor [Rhizomicrobium sp.]